MAPAWNGEYRRKAAAYRKGTRARHLDWREYMRVEERFLKYVSFWTTSEDGKDVTPSTDRQFLLADELAKELKGLGLTKVKRDGHCYVYGLLPATEGFEGKSLWGLLPIWIRQSLFLGKM